MMEIENMDRGLKLDSKVKTDNSKKINSGKRIELNDDLYINKRLNEIPFTEGTVSFHMPGHKYGKVYDRLGYRSIMENLYKTDTTEIPGTDDLHSPEDIIKKSMEKAERVFKSKKTYFVVNGSTCGIQAAIQTICYPGDKIILNRDCHQSAVNACIMGDLTPVYIKAETDNKSGIQRGTDPDIAVKIIENNKDAKAVFLTYPTYYGITYDLEKICKCAHRNNMMVIVDEAHGAHIGLSDSLPMTALECGADIAIQSTHKTLPAFTRSSMIHLNNDEINTDRLDKMLSITETSSPSYILMQSLEIATDIYEKYGKELMSELLDNINLFIKNTEKIKEELIRDNKLKNNNFYNVYCENDKTKVFISSAEIGIPGYEFERILREEHKIQVELSNYYGVLMICTIGNEKNDFEKMESALKEIYLNHAEDTPIDFIEYPDTSERMVLTPREAFYSRNVKSVEIDKSEGMICAENIVPYPPGVCMIAAGEKIQRDAIDYLKYCREKGMNICGMKDENFEYIQIIERN